MFKTLLLCVSLISLDAAVANVILNEVGGDKQLVLAFVINRHGERTPDSDELSLSQEQDKLKNITKMYGLEALTNLGRQRAYQLGKFFRQRYGTQGLNLISNLYLPDEIAIRSTNKERTKMTVLVAMAAAYPPEEDQQWDEGLGKVWQPIPYNAAPLSEDYLRYYSNCKRFKTLMAEAKNASLNEEFAPYMDLIPKIKEETGRNFTEDPLLFETLYDLFTSQKSFGIELPQWAKPYLPRLHEAARLAYTLYFRNDEMKKIGGGVILNDFLQAASDLSQGKTVTQRLRIYSAHDFNMGALMDVTRVAKEKTIPEYGSMFALELYKLKSGQFSVLPVYLPKAGGSSSAKEYTFEGCEDQYCGLAQFKEMTKQFVLPESEFYQICGIKTELSEKPLPKSWALVQLYQNTSISGSGAVEKSMESSSWSHIFDSIPKLPPFTSAQTSSAPPSPMVVRGLIITASIIIWNHYVMKTGCK